MMKTGTRDSGLGTREELQPSAKDAKNTKRTASFSLRSGRPLRTRVFCPSRIRSSEIRVPKCRGFTLIELLVALVIFATMAAIAYAGLGSVTRAHAALDARERDLAALGRTLTLIERDLRAAAWRPVRDGEGLDLPALFGQAEFVELSAYGRGRSVGIDLGMIERVGYLRDEDGLHRQRWPVLDRVRTTTPDRRLLLADVEQLRWRYLALDGRWHAQWPPASGASPMAVPAAVEFILTHRALGEIHRLIELPQGPRAQDGASSP